MDEDCRNLHSKVVLRSQTAPQAHEHFACRRNFSFLKSAAEAAGVLAPPWHVSQSVLLDACSFQDVPGARDSANLRWWSRAFGSQPCLRIASTETASDTVASQALYTAWSPDFFYTAAFGGREGLRTKVAPPRRRRRRRRAAKSSPDVQRLPQQWFWTKQGILGEQNIHAQGRSLLVRRRRAAAAATRDAAAHRRGTRMKTPWRGFQLRDGDIFASERRRALCDVLGPMTAARCKALADCRSC